VVSGRGDDQLIGGIAVKGLGELTALDQDGSRQFPQAQTGSPRRGVEPLVEGTVQDQLLLGDQARYRPLNDNVQR